MNKNKPNMAYTNTNLKPTEVNDHPWLYCYEIEISQKYSSIDCGKWMMFFKKNILDEKWSIACDLYRQRKLTGISWMKVSTANDNDRASDKDSGVIIFYCGPARDHKSMIEYGKNLLVQFPYESNFGAMYYKSDAQTRKGTRATGQENNSLYRIAVPSPAAGISNDQYGLREKLVNVKWQLERGMIDLAIEKLGQLIEESDTTTTKKRKEPEAGDDDN